MKFIIEQRVSSKGSNIKTHSHSKNDSSESTPPKDSLGSDEKRSVKSSPLIVIAEKKGEDGNDSESDQEGDPSKSIFSYD